MDTLTNLSDDEVVEQIVRCAGRVAAAEAQLLALVAEFDRREAWTGVGMLSCAHWLSWRLGLGLGAAYERVRVARALRDLPLTAAAYAAGQLSWSQVRAITRAATPADEATYVDLAPHASGAQLERLVRGVRRARKLAEDAVDPEAAAERMRARVTYDEDGTMVLRVRVPVEQGAVLLAALEQARSALDGSGSAADSSAEESRDRASLAEGLVHVARTFLASDAVDRRGSSRLARYRLTARIDPLSGWARLPDGELLPPGTLGADPADLGRSARAPSLALRERLGTLDGERCRFPGCTRRRRLHAHHVRPWSTGGPTDLANLVLLCGRHHTRVHAEGFRLRLHADRRLSVHTASGEPVLHHPRLPWASTVEMGEVVPRAVPPGDRLDLRYAVGVLLQQAA